MFQVYWQKLSDSILLLVALTKYFYKDLHLEYILFRKNLPATSKVCRCMTFKNVRLSVCVAVGVL